MQDKIKISFVIDSLSLGGAGKLTLDLIKTLENYNYIITLIYFHKSDIQSENLDYGSLKSTKLIQIDFSRHSFFKRVKILYDQLKGQQIVHSCLELANFYCSLVSIVSRNTKFISTIHGIDGIFIDDEILQAMFKKNFGLKYRLMVKYIQTYTFKFIDQFIAVSYHTKKFLIEKRRIPESKIKVIYHGLEIGSLNLPNETKIRDLRSRFKLNKNDFIVGYLGRLASGKGLEYLLDTFEVLYRENCIYKLLVVGDGDIYKELKNVVKEKNLEQVVLFPGNVDNVEDYLCLFDIFILPSFSEGIPISLLEAMYFKRISICTNVGGIPEVLEDNYNGFLIEKNNPLDLLEKVEHARLNFDSLGFIKKNAFNTVVNRFDFRQNVLKIIDILLKPKHRT